MMLSFYSKSQCIMVLPWYSIVGTKIQVSSSEVSWANKCLNKICYSFETFFEIRRKWYLNHTYIIFRTIDEPFNVFLLLRHGVEMIWTKVRDHLTANLIACIIFPHTKLYLVKFINKKHLEWILVNWTWKFIRSYSNNSWKFWFP